MTGEGKRCVYSIEQFCGWNKIKRIGEKAETERDKYLAYALFLTGSRAGEVVRSKYGGLRGGDFWIDGEKLNFRMRLLKSYKKVAKKEDGKHWITERNEVQRRFFIPMDEPLVENFLKYSQTFSKNDLLFDICTVRAWQILTKLDSSVWVHWFRSQRAHQLKEEYDFNRDMLMDWFFWKNYSTALRYSRGALNLRFPQHVQRIE